MERAYIRRGLTQGVGALEKKAVLRKESTSLQSVL